MLSPLMTKKIGGVLARLNRAAKIHAALLFAAVFVASCTSSAPPPPAADNAVLELGTNEYTLASGDRIRITVFGQENLSGERDVTGTGTVSIPLIGDILALGLTTAELEDRIEAEFTNEQILVSPRVGVEVLNFRPFFILGEVGNPGQYEYEAGLSVIGAVAKAGGFSYRANQETFELQRGGSNAAKVSVGGATAILPGDILTVKERWF